jgi:hypothetical protein
MEAVSSSETSVVAAVLRANLRFVCVLTLEQWSYWSSSQARGGGGEFAQTATLIRRVNALVQFVNVNPIKTLKSVQRMWMYWMWSAVKQMVDSYVV